MSRLGVILAVLLGGAMYASTVAAQPAASASKPVAKASANAASNPCRECHDPAEVKVHANHGNCESCHRDTAAHLKDPMTASPSKSIPPENCLSCHASGGGHARDANRMNFAFSEHSKAGVQCSDCHGIHNPKVGRQANVADVRMDNNARLCATCHQDVLARFSMRSHHPVREGGATWKGVFIRAAAGAEVKAIAAGRIVFADWLRGFGNLAIVDHDDGYLSVYGNNESLFGKAGQAVKAGETIAAVGNSGGNPETGLYFELRHLGLPIDPLRWVGPR